MKQSRLKVLRTLVSSSSLPSWYGGCDGRHNQQLQSNMAIRATWPCNGGVAERAWAGRSRRAFPSQTWSFCRSYVGQRAAPALPRFASTKQALHVDRFKNAGYAHGQEYHAHSDFIHHPTDPAGPRVFTFFLFLNSPEHAGAATWLPISSRNNPVLQTGPQRPPRIFQSATTTRRPL